MFVFMLTLTQLDKSKRVSVAAASSDDGDTYIMWGVSLSGGAPQKTSSKPPALNAKQPTRPKHVLTKPGHESKYPGNRGHHRS